MTPPPAELFSDFCVHGKLLRTVKDFTRLIDDTRFLCARVRVSVLFFVCILLGKTAKSRGPEDAYLHDSLCENTLNFMWIQVHIFITIFPPEQSHHGDKKNVNSTRRNTARKELHSMSTFHHANTRGSRAAKLRIAHLCVPETLVIHVSCLIPCRT